MSKSVKYKINLIPQDPFFKTKLGQAMTWSLNVGRYIVIFTQVVVIIGFASRFVLDRMLTDLNESIYQKKLMIESQAQLERDFRLAQAKISSYQQLQQQSNLVEVFPLLQQIVPTNFRLRDLTIQQSQISGNSIAFSNEAVNLFISNLQLSPHFENITVSRIEASERRGPGFEVTFKADFII